MPNTAELDKIRSGDVKAFEAIFASYYQPLCHYSMKFIRDPDEAEEVVQDMFVRFWNKRNELNITVSLKSYLYQSVKYACLNRLKHQKVVRAHEQHHIRQSSANEDSDVLVEQELEDKIQASLEKLPPERKKIFLMSRNEELKYKEIAEKLNISIKTVENQMGKALKLLREELAEFLVITMISLLEIIKSIWI